MPAPSSKTDTEPEHRFGVSPPLTIGVEEELLLVDERQRLIAAAERVLSEIEPDLRAGVTHRDLRHPDRAEDRHLRDAPQAAARS